MLVLYFPYNYYIASYKGFSLSASTSVAEANEEASAYESVFFDKKEICTLGVLEYKYSNQVVHDVTDEFATDVESLPTNLDSSYNELQYRYFIEKYGTVSVLELMLYA